MQRHRIIALIGFSAPLVIGSALFAGDLETATSGTTEKTANPEYDSNTRIHRDRMVKALDSLRNKVEEWGVVTISAPVAVLNPRAFFVPDNIVSPDEAYKEAQSEVQASAVQATEVGVGNQFTGVATPTTIIPAAPRPPAGGSSTQTTSTSTTVTSPPNPAASPSPAQPSANANGTPIPSLNAEALSTSPATAETFGFKKEVTEPFKLGPEKVPTPTKSVAAALREAQDNTMRQKIYSQMSYPNGIEGYNQVIFAIVEVSCNPGWRTKEHYIAECSASLEYSDLSKNKHLSRAVQRAPTVFSVLPLLDAQTVEMANSQREVTQLAFQLAASLPAHGVNIKAKDLFQFVRRYSRDLRSRTPIPVVNSYSSGETFGFRFSPSFQAMRDPAQKNARAANVLLPTSFPALITVVIHQADIDFLQAQAAEPGILTHVSTRWFLKDRPPLWQLPKRLFTPMRRNTAKMEVNAAENVASVYLVKKDFKDATGRPEDGYFNPMYEEVRRNIIALQAKGIGRDWPISLKAAFLEAKRDADAKMRDRLEQMEDHSDYIQDLQKKVEEVNLGRQASETEVDKANTISVSMNDNGKIKTIKFDKRPLGNVSGDKLAEMVGSLFKTSEKPDKAGGNDGDQSAGNADGEASIKDVKPPKVILDANETEQKFIVSGPGLDDVKGADLGEVLKTKDVKSKVKGKSLAVSFKFPSTKDADKSKLKDGDQLDLKLVDDKDEEVATKPKAVTIKTKAANQESSASPATPAKGLSPVTPAGTASPTLAASPTSSATSKSGVTPDGTAIPKSDAKKSP